MLFQPELKITKTDNGYVLEWSKDEPSNYQSIGTVPRKTRGIEVFTSKKALLERVRALL